MLYSLPCVVLVLRQALIPLLRRAGVLNIEALCRSRSRASLEFMDGSDTLDLRTDSYILL